jgi:hypothetical protein
MLAAMSLAVEVRDVPLRIVAFDGRAIAGSFFLHLVGDHGGRPETVGDRLNDPETRFVPVRVEERVELLHLAWIAYVACPGELPEVAEREAVGCRRERVELELAGGARLAGELLYALPPGHARVSDLLNTAGERFLLLLAAGETLFVNRAAIVRARTD